MKTLELQLKKDVIIVEIPRLADYEFINRECKYLKVGKEEIKLNASTLDKFEFLCKGSELTEEIASELVDKSIYTGLYAHYVDKIPVNTYCYNSAIESFISGVESKKFYWLKNPIDEPNKYVQKCMSFENLSNQFKLFDEKEEKTFRNPLIFVKK
jgi:hypothetical protein